MRPHERLELARASYARAIDHARRGSSPASWRRVLAAAKNVAQAKRDEARSRSGSTPSLARETNAGPVARSRRCRIFTLSRGPDESGVRAVRAWPVLSETLAELDAHRMRAEILMQESARLVARTRALQAALIEERLRRVTQRSALPA